MRSRQPAALLGLLTLLGSTLAVACAATPAPDSFENGSSAGSRGAKKSTKATNDTSADDDEGGDTPAPASTGDLEDRPAPIEETPAPPAAPIEASDTTWTGTLAKTPASKFGGSPYCEYQTHLENVSVTVVVGADGKIKSATVKGEAVEASLNGCPNKPIPPNLHDYTLATEVDGTSFAVDGGGAAAKPHAKMDGDFSAAGTTGTIALKWHRNDQKPPLDWTINATVPLTKK